MELIFPPVEDSINLASPHEPDSTELVPYPAWGGEYNDILQSNTCSIDNILAIISSNKTTITKSLELIGTTPSKTKFYCIFELAADCKFEKLRDFIAKEIGLKSIEIIGKDLRPLLMRNLFQLQKCSHKGCGRAVSHYHYVII